jgi:hypothetical protein
MAHSFIRFGSRHWRDRAAEARDNAARMQDPEAKRLMLEIAATFDELAKKAEEGRA